MPIWRVNGGDSMILTTQVLAPNGDPATSANSRLNFVLRQTRFCPDPPFWVAGWDTGVTAVTGTQPGVVKITIPDDISDSLRRGSYHFSMAVSDRFGKNTYTALEGYLLVEYMPSSPQHDIPYRSDDD